MPATRKSLPTCRPTWNADEVDMTIINRTPRIVNRDYPDKAIEKAKPNLALFDFIIGLILVSAVSYCLLVAFGVLPMPVV